MDPNGKHHATPCLCTCEHCRAERGALVQRKRVIIESPFASDTEEGRTANRIYLGQAVRDSIARGEAPYASHGFYTHFLDDTIPEERAIGIECGIVWAKDADLVAVYYDRGVSKGMKLGLEAHRRAGKEIVWRKLYRQTQEVTTEMILGRDAEIDSGEKKP